MNSAHLVLWMADLSKKPWLKELEADIKDLGNTPMLLVGNKIDLVAVRLKKPINVAGASFLGLSCKTRKGLPELKRTVSEIICSNMPDLTSGAVVTSARHLQKLVAAMRSLKTAKTKIKKSETPELTAFDLRQAVTAMDEITGKVYNEDILGKIFSKFCIGK